MFWLDAIGFGLVRGSLAVKESIDRSSYFHSSLLAGLLDALGTGVEGTLAAGLGGEFLAGLLLCGGGNCVSLILGFLAA